MSKITGQDEDGLINFDLDRMKAAVEAPSIIVPRFETREEFHEWVNNLTDEDFT